MHRSKACVVTAPDEDPLLEEESVRILLEFSQVVALADAERHELPSSIGATKAIDP
jgi:hypothetical protein